MKVKDTYYKGYHFRSRLEARWAVFFDELGIKWEYEPEGFVLDNGMSYLPDFFLHGLEGRVKGDLYVEVKGKATDEDYKKIYGFCGIQEQDEHPRNRLFVVAGIPDGTTIREITWNTEDMASNGLKTESGHYIYPFNFETLDGDDFAAHIGLNKNGKPEIFGDDDNYLCNRDDARTLKAYLKARQARFEFGETPEGRD